jgi:hypothetical protein
VSSKLKACNVDFNDVWDVDFFVIVTVALQSEKSDNINQDERYINAA